MTAELVRGQNHPLPVARLEIRVSAGKPVLAGATLSDEQGRVRGAEWVAHPGSPQLPGLEVSRQAAADHRLAVDLEALPEAVHRVNVLLALPTGPGGPSSFASVAAPFTAVTGPAGAEVVSYTITGLGAESAVVALELYCRQGAWKVRAVGQGYAGGLADLLGDQGLPGARDLADAIQAAAVGSAARSVAPPCTAQAPPHTVPGGDVRPGPGFGDRPEERATTPVPQSPRPVPGEGPGVPGAGGRPEGGPVDYTHPRRQRAAPPTPPPAVPGPRPGEQHRPVAGDATGWSMEERLYNQVRGMFEDLARAAAAYRSAVDFADSRLEREIDEALSDPRSRTGSAGAEARRQAQEKRDGLAARAREVLDRDLDQLVAESEVVEPALAPAFARWDHPVWHGYRVPAEAPLALRAGDLHLPVRPGLRIPMLVRLPLERGLWVDSGRTGSGAELDSAGLRTRAMDTAVAHAARLLAVHPAGEFTVQVIDPAGSGAGPLAPLTASGVLDAPPATGAQGVAAVLARLVQRVDLVQMAVRGGAADSLPPDLDPAEQLLIVNDFPHGFDDRALTHLRYLADEGPSVGVHLLMVADREDAREYGPVLDPLWRSLLRITPVPDDHIADPWVGHAWTYEPSLPPPGSEVLRNVLDQVAAARRVWPRPVPPAP
ncbi:TerD family protein [Streptomyces sp. NBC_01306]|uniref:TerD family protein n=1 Tax=Streptomyces sp. NBC_01306 TaxID=2903819 RepID=UPI00224EF839|nr:TerD family protein [Streptomyces sp. NBC_01306]MCX4727256.1 TerD family protein [Streptomyces sp. NBC_01306]